MKKLIGILLSLYFIYFFVEFLFLILGDGYHMSYTVVNESGSYNVDENLSSNQKFNDDFYSFTINDKFRFRIYQNISKKSGIIKDIYSYKDDQIECIYPVFKDENIMMDVLCKKDQQQVFYHNIRGENTGVDQFVFHLADYNAQLFEDNMSKSKKVGLATEYVSNFNENYYLALSSYKGIYNLRSENSKVLDLFSHDVYDRSIQAIVGNYYLTANYDLQYHFSSFLIVNLIDSSESELNYNGEFSFQSYVQGVIDGNLYLFDPENKKQYKINPKKKSIEIISEMDQIQYFNGKEFVNRHVDDAVNNRLIFSFDEYNNEQTITSFGEKSGYRYFRNNGVVTRASLNNLDDLTYLFSYGEMKNISFYKDMIFFVDHGFIKMYSDSTGLRTLARMDELNFNSTLSYHMYIK